MGLPKRIAAEMINLNPIQAGGVVPREVKEQLFDWLDGYSVCDYCPGRLEGITKPPIKRLVEEELPRFLNADVVRLTHGAREGKYAVMHALKVFMGHARAPVVVVDANAHYSTFLAAERAGLEVAEVPRTDPPEYLVQVDRYSDVIEEVKRRYGKPPLLALITYPDGSYGNLPDARKVVEICHDMDVPVLVNAAYAAGRMPVDFRALGADFLVASGHKSMACVGPIGVLALREEWEGVVLRRSARFTGKEVELLGCTVRGVPAVSMILSLPYVEKRVREWDSKVELARKFSAMMEEMGGFVQYGEKPHNHDLLFFESPALYEISKREGRFFLYRELKKRGIVGIKPGLTRYFKLSTYLLDWEKAKYVVDAFREILEKYGVA